MWRGVPAAVDRTAFWWEAPDGSRVRAEHLWGSYANGRDVTFADGRKVFMGSSGTGAPRDGADTSEAK